MRTEIITSSSNGQIKHLKELQNKAKTRRETGTFVAEGRKMAEEACVLGVAKHLYFSESFVSGNDISWAEGFPCTMVSDSVLKDAADTMNPQGVLAIIKQPSWDMEEILSRDSLRLLLLEDVRDPGNLGTMMRTAEGAGVDAVLMSKGTVDLYNPKVVRSTMGSIYRVPYLYREDFLELIQELKDRGITVLAAHLKGQAYHDEITYPEKVAVLIGNEANGLTDAAADAANLYVKIPMGGQLESLNAAVAAALLMYQMRRRG